MTAVVGRDTAPVARLSLRNVIHLAKRNGLRTRCGWRLNRTWLFVTWGSPEGRQCVRCAETLALKGPVSP